MYEGSFNLTKPPFQLTPDPAFLYLSPSHREAFASIVYGVDQRKGLIVVVGEVGLGKTTVLRSYLEGRDRDRIVPIYLFNPNLSFDDLVGTIARELGIEDTATNLARRLERVHTRLIDEYRLGRNVVLMIDEAQNVPADTLEQLRVLSNLETSTEKLLQIVLVGQPELASALDRHELRQLKQRIAVRVTLAALSPDESIAYIEHRLTAAGGSTAAIFAANAIRRIVDYAAGVPRILNIVCDNALVTTLGYSKTKVTLKIVDEVLHDLGAEAKATPRPRNWSVAAVALAVAGAVLGFVLYGRPEASSRPPSVVDSGPMFAIPARIPEPPSSITESPVLAALPTAPPTFQADAAAVPALAEGPLEVATPRTLEPVAADGPRHDGLPAMPVSDSVTRVVREGEWLLMMARDVYGFATPQLMRRILDSNPAIVDPDHLEVGTAVHFPDAADLRPGNLPVAPKGQ